MGSNKSLAIVLLLSPICTILGHSGVRMNPHRVFAWTVALLLSTLLLASVYPVSFAQAQEAHSNPPPGALPLTSPAFPRGKIQPGVIFCDNAEKGNWGWTETIGAGDSQPGPNTSTWHITARNSFSPTHSWWIGNEQLGNYNTGLVRRILTSPSIRVAEGPATLSYNSFYATIESEEGWDRAGVWLQASSGLMLVKEIVSWDPEDGAGWISFAWDISALAGQTISIVLEFNTFDKVLNSGPGWFVDDICVTGAVIPVGGTVIEPGPTVNLLLLLPCILVVVVAVGAGAYRMRKRYGSIIPPSTRWAGGCIQLALSLDLSVTSFFHRRLVCSLSGPSFLQYLSRATHIAGDPQLLAFDYCLVRQP
jgi:hypothetical protein